MQIKNLLAFSSTLLLTSSQLAYAGPNDFFGGGVPGSTPGDPASAVPMAPPSGDYSEDEKRMQKKYKQSIVHAKELIEKGEYMLKKGQNKRDNRLIKKGQIFKEIGEKQLAELQNNNPFENMSNHKEKASNPSQL